MIFDLKSCGQLHCKMEDSRSMICKQPVGKCLMGLKEHMFEHVTNLRKSPSFTMTEKGCVRIKKASEARKDVIKPLPGQEVHQDWQRKYCNPQQIAKCIKQGTTEEAFLSDRQVLQSADEKFSFNSSCSFCSQPAIMGSKRKGFGIISVKMIELKDILLTVCQERNDAWATSVQAEIVSAHDMHAEDAVYHIVNFRIMRQTLAG